VPVVGDAAVVNLDKIGSDKGDRLTRALRRPNSPVKWPVKFMYGDVVVGDYHLLHCHLEIGYGSGELSRGKCAGPSGTCGRPGGKVWSVKFFSMA
jgi:hypothetical protein